MFEMFSDLHGELEIHHQLSFPGFTVWLGIFIRFSALVIDFLLLFATSTKRWLGRCKMKFYLISSELQKTKTSQRRKIEVWNRMKFE